MQLNASTALICLLLYLFCLRHLLLLLRRRRRRRRLPLQHLDEFSREPTLATVARTTLPPLRLDLDPRVDFHPRARIQLAHHRHDLVLMQTELGRRRSLERVRRARERQLRRVQGREHLPVRREDTTTTAGGPLPALTLALLLLFLLELLLLLLLRRALGEYFDELVHRVWDAEDREEEEHERFLARVGRGSGRARGGAVYRTSVEELAKLVVHLARAGAGAPAREEFLEPANETEQAEDASERVAQLGELVDDAREREEGRVGGHEGRLQHLSETGKGLHDRVEEREGRGRRRLERLRHARVRGVVRHSGLTVHPDGT